MKEICQNIFQETINYPNLNSSPRNLYVIRSEGRSLMVDTSYRLERDLQIIQRMIAELGIDYHNLDIFVTHDHPDHVGLVPDLQERGARAFMNPEELDMHTDVFHSYLFDRQIRIANLRIVGVTPEHTPEVYRAIMKYMDIAAKARREPPAVSTIPIHPGEMLNYGGYHFEVVPMRGHTYGQCGLYEKEHKLLFCGDQIMTTIAPIVATQQTDRGLLKKYLASMSELKHHYVDCRLLPCHYGPIADIPREVDRIVLSYLDKCEIMKEVLEQGDRWMTTREVGVRAYGHNDAPPDYEHFLTCVQIWIKTFSCLEYLHDEGFVERTEQDGILYWYAKR